MAGWMQMNKNLSKSAIKLLRQVKIDILLHPRNYDQWESQIPDLHTCGSVGCIYGYIGARKGFPSHLSKSDLSSKVRDEVMRENSIQYSLYSDWPAPLGGFLGDTDLPLKKAIVAACAIELFIITDGFTDF